MAVLAVLPVHAIYAGFVLRESLVVLMSILAVWTPDRGLAGGAGRARSIVGPGRPGRALRRAGGPGTDDRAGDAGRGRAVFVLRSRTAGSRIAIVPLGWAPSPSRCLPWALATFAEYGTPVLLLYQPISNTTSPGPSTITRRATRSPRSFTRRRTLPEIVRVKVKSSPDHRHLLDHDRGPADRPGLLPAAAHAGPAGSRNRPAGRVDLRWCSCWRRSRASPT